jgi:hypothetical protein
LPEEAVFVLIIGRIHISLFLAMAQVFAALSGDQWTTGQFGETVATLNHNYVLGVS